MRTKVIITALLFPFLFFSQKSSGLSAEGIAFYSVKKIQHHTKRYRNKLVTKGSKKAVRRFIYKKGRTAAKRRRKK